MEKLPPFQGTEEQLKAAATQATGLEDFGDADTYMTGLLKLLEAMDNDGPRFTPQGYEFARGIIIGPLISRLLAVQGWKDRPDSLEQPIRKPLIIMGLPRTGTTALHKLLSVDPQFQGLDRWLTAFPMPRPPRQTWPDNPWYQACVKGLEDFFAMAPEMRAAHDMRADDVDECLEVLKDCFCSNHYGSCLRIPRYDAWWRQQSEADSYRYLHNVMQLIGVDSPDQTWLLKNPGHVHHVDLLLKTFPDACVVQTHRDPVKALPSLCSVLAQSRAIVEGDAIDRHEIGTRELDNWSHALEDCDRKRQIAPEQFIDIQQSDIHKNPMTVVREIYAKAGLELTDSVEQAMAERIERNPEGSQGVHSYTVEEFGFSEADIRAAFRSYIDNHLGT